MNNRLSLILILLIFSLFWGCSKTENSRMIQSFNDNWQFTLQPDSLPIDTNNGWRSVNLPHDWSIEGEFSDSNPATPGGGALPGGIGWYKKSFLLPVSDSGKRIFIDFDGVYRNSEVYINGNLLGVRPNGYISFRYDLTPYLNFGDKKNTLTVIVNNSKQPNSRWYSGSGIYRNVWLVKTNPVYVDLWGTYITSSKKDGNTYDVSINTRITNSTDADQSIVLENEIINDKGKVVGTVNSGYTIKANTSNELKQSVQLVSPTLWSLANPYLYKAKSTIKADGIEKDNYETNFGIRTFKFDADKGFFLNEEPVKILGVCNHHDLGCLGAAVNTRAIERQLEILKAMGCNGIRTSHNPPAPELLDLCDKMGFIVMDEAFDMWKKKKTPYDYSLYWDEWHKKDLIDQILRDRNHPSIFVWSIGNEIVEQWDTSGIRVATELAKIVKELDTTRPVTAACNPPSPENNVVKSNALDLIGYNYAHAQYEKFHEIFPGKIFIGTETVSGLMTRGKYDMPSDSIRRWPVRWDIPFTQGNPDNTVSAYDNISAPWGSTHEETWKIIKKHDFLSGMYIWTGFDYLGEPTPYGWPSRSSYFGIIDLAGFPKDVYYMYQSEWTSKPVLHVFPHWNWKEGQTVDMVAYSNCEEVELFLNGNSLGTKKKGPEDLRLTWQVKYVPGTIKAVGRSNGKQILEQTINTAGVAEKIVLTPDRATIKADGQDLSFVTVDIVDKDGNLVPDASNMVNFTIEGEAIIVGVDNGNQTSHEPFKANYRSAFNGKCLVVIQSKGKKGEIVLKASSKGIEDNSIKILID